MKTYISQYLLTSTLVLISIIFSSSSVYSQDLSITMNGQAGTIVAQVDIDDPNYLELYPPPYHFTWSISGNVIFEETNSTGGSGVSGLDFGEYCLVVMNASGCEAQGCFTLCPPLIHGIEVTDATPTTLGAIEITPEGPPEAFTYEWDNNNISGSSGTGLGAGEYTVTITDLHTGCSEVETILIKLCDDAATPPIVITLQSSTDPHTHCSSDGAIDVNVTGGISPYSYNWVSNADPNFTANTQDISGLPTAEYTLTVTDFLCNVQTFLLKIYPQKDFYLEIDAAVSTSANCLRKIDLEVKGGTLPYTYTWSNGETMPDIDGLTPGGEYLVQVMDANGCETKLLVDVGYPDELLIIPSIQGTCQGLSEGSIVPEIKNALPPLSFEWSTGELTESIFGVSQGIYTLTVTDANSCVKIETFEVESNVEANADVIQICSPIFQIPGSIILSPSGGNPPYSYNWSSNANSSNNEALNLSSGTYSVTITDDDNCFREESFFISNQEEWTTEWNYVSVDNWLTDAINQNMGHLVIFEVGSCQQWANCNGASQNTLVIGGLEYSVNGFDWFPFDGACTGGGNPIGSNITVRCIDDNSLATGIDYIGTIVDGPYDTGNGCFNNNYCVFFSPFGYFIARSQVEVPCLKGSQVEQRLSSSKDSKMKKIDSYINVYPNPFKESFVVEIKGDTEIRDIKIFSSVGETVLHKKIDKNKANKVEIEFDTNYPVGVYQIQVLDSNGKKTYHKVVHVD